jgi:hypothetical protein
MRCAVYPGQTQFSMAMLRIGSPSHGSADRAAAIVDQHFIAPAARLKALLRELANAPSKGSGTALPAQSLHTIGMHQLLQTWHRAVSARASCSAVCCIALTPFRPTVAAIFLYELVVPVWPCG